MKQLIEAIKQHPAHSRRVKMKHRSTRLASTEWHLTKMGISYERTALERKLLGLSDTPAIQQRADAPQGPRQ